MNRIEKNKTQTDQAWNKLHNRLETDGLLPTVTERRFATRPTAWIGIAAIAAIISLCVYLPTVLRTDRHLSNQYDGPPSSGAHRCGCLLLHGFGASDSATDYAGADHRRRAKNRHEADEKCIQKRKNCLSHCRNHYCLLDFATGYNPGRYAHAGQSP